MSRIVKIKKGLNIPVPGSATSHLTKVTPAAVGITPDDFPGYRWRPVAAPGDKVVVGTPLFEAKEDDDIKLVSPVAGRVENIRRGDRRHILDMRIIPEGRPDECVNIELPDSIPDFGPAGNRSKRFDSAEWLQFQDKARAAIKHSGLWAMMRQRPFDVVPAAEIIPDNIFITAFDSAPGAPELMNSIDSQDIYKGLQVLDALTYGTVYLGCAPNQANQLEVVANQKAVITVFDGPHPAGNVGPQIAAIAPVAKGSTYWTLDIRTLAAIGYLFNTNEIDMRTVIAVTGPEVSNPHLVETLYGADMQSLLSEFDINRDKELRVISGNVLTGYNVERNSGYLRYPYRQVSIIEEGEHIDEFMGWASMSPNKFSVKRMLPSGLFKSERTYRFDTRLLGGHRAMILTGELDSVFPFDIYPEYLLKATMVSDYDRMENLGIYEVAPEDFALPEFVDTSKQPLQQIIREGLERLRADQ
ncbi:MAG: NADH:ubiquinone reductase (Na(+)-transporting) subunit A [Muribaculaceae bacterium]|nr:NADH:ubiquinone reductase (Na(+)-transporting) subunit A [Muribaculaceae bacterium]